MTFEYWCVRLVQALGLGIVALGVGWFALSAAEKGVRVIKVYGAIAEYIFYRKDFKQWRNQKQGQC